MFFGKIDERISAVLPSDMKAKQIQNFQNILLKNLKLGNFGLKKKFIKIVKKFLKNSSKNKYYSYCINTAVKAKCSGHIWQESVCIGSGMQKQIHHEVEKS